MGESWTATIGSMDEQLRVLYAEKEALASALGTADAQTIIAMIRSLESDIETRGPRSTKIQSTVIETTQKEPANAESHQGEPLPILQSEILQRELHTTNANEIVKMVRSMELQLKDLYAEREDAIVVEGSRITIVGPKRLIVRKIKPENIHLKD